MNLSKHLFWDADYHAIDWERHKGFVIQRVFSKGTLADWRQINAFYGEENVIKSLLQQRYLDKKTLNFASYFYNIPKEKFRCYNSSLSGQKLWIY